jgi:hypothetical protein
VVLGKAQTVTLYKQSITNNTNTILTDEERKELLHLSRLVQKLYETLSHNQLNTVVRAEKMEVYISVSDPATNTSLSDYALDFVASYADYAEDADVANARRTETVLAHLEHNLNDWTTDADCDLRSFLGSCARAIEVIA